MGTLRDADHLLATHVRASLAQLPLTDADQAAARLALTYAQQIDDLTGADDDGKLGSWAIRWIGPLLLDALESLGATPAARARLKPGRPADEQPSGLAKLRAARGA